MANVLEILLRLKDQASRELKQFDKNLNKTAKNAEDADRSFKEFQKGMMAIAGVTLATGLAVKAVVDDTVEYGKQVDDLSRALGTNTEEASKLIQVADDLRIEYGQLKTAFRIALRQGVTPNIEGIKDLAQEYQQLESPSARAQFALEKFGRSGLEMQKILELDAEALDEMAQSAEDAGLVLSGDAVQATIDYHMATDQLGDSLEGLKTQLGIAIIPALTKSTSNFNKNAAAIKRVKEEYDAGRMSAWEFYHTFPVTGQYVEKNAELLERLAKETEALQVAEEDEISTKQRFISAMSETEDAAWGAMYVLGGMPQVTAEVGEAFAESEAKIRAAAEAMRLDMNRATTEMLQNLRELKQQKIEMAFDIDIDPGAIAAKLSDVVAFKEAGGEAINSYIEQIKAGWAEGKIDDAEAQEFFKNAYVEAQNLAVEMGDIDLSEAQKNIEENFNVPTAEAKRLLDEAKASADLLGATKLDALKTEFDDLQDLKQMLIGAGELDPENQIAINADPNDKALNRLNIIEQELIGMTSKVWTINVQVNKPGGKATIYDDNRAGGGYVSPMTPYLVGERGPELFVPDAAGTIVPNNRLRGGGYVDNRQFVTQHFHSAGAAALGMAIVEEARGKRLDAAMGG